MEPAKRIIINTIAQYAKSILNIFLSFYSTRLILEALSIAEYGIFSVVGGTVAMLGFITNALAITTQRYISIHIGNTKTEYLRKIFINSLFLHIIIALGLLLILLSLWGLLANDILNIDISRLITAKYVYILTVLMLALTIISTPFKALLITHENIIYISIIESIDGVIKVLFAIWLLNLNANIDKLLIYTIMMTTITTLNMLAFLIYANLKYKECSIKIHHKSIDYKILRKLISFAGWSTYGMGAVAGRNQGTAVVLNHYFGTTINAAYGLATQVNGAISFVVSSILNSMNPQIMQAEGDGNRQKALRLAEKQSKFSAALLVIVAIPLIIEMPDILSFWLKNIPEYTCLFCRFVLIALLCDQITLGLNAINQAIGNIRNYIIITYTPKLLFLPIIYFYLAAGGNILNSMIIYVSIEIITAVLRLPYTKKRAGISITQYFYNVIFPLIPLFFIISYISYIITYVYSGTYRFIITILLSCICGLITLFIFTLSKEEKEHVKRITKKLRR